jgi:hypothetical protein
LLILTRKNNSVFQNANLLYGPLIPPRLRRAYRGRHET